jgi:hypothetical protein
MYALGITMSVLGGLTFGSIVVYYLIDHRRTGVLYRKHKRRLFPVAILGWLLVATGAVTAGVANGELGIAADGDAPRHALAISPRSTSIAIAIRNAL